MNSSQPKSKSPNISTSERNSPAPSSAHSNKSSHSIERPAARATTTAAVADRGSRRQTLANRRASIRLDVASFAAEGYRPEVYLRSTMEADTEDAVQSALRTLTVAAEKSVAELRRAVYKNHGEFLEVGKGIMEFENGLSELRDIQTALKSAANALIMAAGVADFVSFGSIKHL